MARAITIAYTTAHNRLRATRGPASEWLCAYHGDHFADHWAYTGLADVELTGMHTSRNRYSYEYTYSADHTDYISLCRKEHVRFDTIHRNAENTIIGEEDESGMWLL